MYLVALFVLCILIFVHELGHFLLAKWNNVGVLAFSIGFGPVLFKKQYGETTYTFRLFPLGGYVRMVGDDPRYLEPDFSPEEEEDPSLEKLQYDDFTEVQKLMIEDQNRWFLKKGYWPKFWIVFAGPAFNIIFAVILAIASVYIYGEAEVVEKAVIGDVIPDHPAEQAGIRAKDLVLSIDSNPISTWQELADTVRTSGGKELTLQILRDDSESGQQKEITILVKPEENRSGLVTEEEREKGDVYRIGISPDFVRNAVSFSEAVVSGSQYCWFITYQTVIGIKSLIVGTVSLDNIAGPVRIFQEAGRSAEKGLDYLFGFMVFLSISLAVLNLLPIPVLDGGHIVFFTIEALKGSPVSLKVREVATQVGMVLLLGLMIFAVGNDLFR
ncbi:MAG: RIP metalloprotease RseP [Deltaproteobacteria bacterium]|nr:RIP metalloprotease RseP [Deltaproteobacteria bacterium]